MLRVWYGASLICWKHIILDLYMAFMIWVSIYIVTLLSGPAMQSLLDGLFMLYTKPPRWLVPVLLIGQSARSLWLVCCSLGECLYDTCARAKCRCYWKCRRKFRLFPDAPVAHSKMHKNECKCLCNRLNFGPYENTQNTVLTEKEKTVTPLVLDWGHLQVNIWQYLHRKWRH